MKRVALVLGLALTTSGCGLFASAPPAVVAPRVASEPKATAHSDRAPGDRRKVGDFTVHRFTGTFQKAPLTLTEEIVAQEGVYWVIDYTLEEASGTTKLRVRFDPQIERVERVARLDGKNEVSVALAVYERMIERTTFAADSNDGLIQSVRSTCLVGPSELDCETKSYKVSIGDQEATLSVARSASVPGGDVTGDITTKDGTLVYRSELLEMGNGSAPKRGLASR
jgi:hypothetical protein